MQSPAERYGLRASGRRCASAALGYRGRVGLQDIQNISHPWLDKRHAPLLLANYPPRIVDRELVSFMDVQVALVTALGSPYAWVIDAGPLVTMTAVQRKIVADYEKRLERIDGEFLFASAIVARSALVRGAVTAVYWLKPPVYPYKIFAGTPEAIVWAKNQLIERGVRVAGWPTPPPL